MGLGFCFCGEVLQGRAMNIWRVFWVSVLGLFCGAFSLMGDDRSEQRAAFIEANEAKLALLQQMHGQHLAFGGADCEAWNVCVPEFERLLADYKNGERSWEGLTREEKNRMTGLDLEGLPLRHLDLVTLTEFLREKDSVQFCTSLCLGMNWISLKGCLFETDAELGALAQLIEGIEVKTGIQFVILGKIPFRCKNVGALAEQLSLVGRVVEGLPGAVTSPREEPGQTAYFVEKWTVAVTI